MSLRVLLFCLLFLCAAGIGWGLSAEAAMASCAEGPGRETSADYLQRTAHCLFDISDKAGDALRLTLIDDIYIKSWSYSVLNKGCFWLAVTLALLVLIFPALAPIFGPTVKEGEEAPKKSRFQKAISSASVQTSVTALAAASFAFYAHYKEKQSLAEALMRELMVKEVVEEDYLISVATRIADMDKGFGFASTGATK